MHTCTCTMHVREEQESQLHANTCHAREQYKHNVPICFANIKKRSVL
jgi:hypothetical protein